MITASSHTDMAMRRRAHKDPCLMHTYRMNLSSNLRHEFVLGCRHLSQFAEKMSNERAFPQSSPAKAVSRVAVWDARPCPSSVGH
eukprot:360988-Chlamydomonas_euryale.AAC.10